VTDGYQAVFRARNLYGPYENRVVLARGSTAINGPHQGAWVDTPEGSDWFLHFQEMPAYGRVVHLQPMRWEDDWPVMGTNIDANGTGEPVASAPLPRRVGGRPTGPATSDEFELPQLGRQWQWQANPQAGWASLETRPGYLRLAAMPMPEGTSLWSAAPLLLQKFPAPAFTATTHVELAPGAAVTAGLVVFGYSYRWIALRRREGRTRIVLSRCDDAQTGGEEREEIVFPIDVAQIHLKVSVGSGAACRFAFSHDGIAFTEVGDPFIARSSMWVGAKVGLFARSSGPTPSPAAFADFDWFRIAPLSP
jgi:beta-xylosidase